MVTEIASDPSLLREPLVSTLHQQLQDADILLIVPPFFNIEYIALGPYTLKALAEQQGYTVAVLHTELILAKFLGVKTYRQIVHRPPEAYYQLIAERFFARSAFGLPPLGESLDCLDDYHKAIYGHEEHVASGAWEVGSQYFSLDEMQAIEELCFDFTQLCAEVIAQYSFQVIGLSIAFESQVHASVALANALARHPHTARIIAGGGYCDYRTEEGLLEICPAFDHVFAGEAERAFLEYLDQTWGKAPEARTVLKSQAPYPLDEIPLVDYGYYAQRVISILGDAFFRNYVRVLWYETNRGCWWGDIARCTFCSIPDTPFRGKSPALVAQQLRQLHQQFPDKVLFFADDIIRPAFIEQYKQAQAGNQLPPIGYMLKISRDEASTQAMRAANTQWVLPGIESFSTPLLKKMKKGTTGKHNLYFLRNMANQEVEVQWNLLFGFPGDEVAHYAYLLELIPLLTHLYPPTAFTPALIGKGAPLFEQADAHGITALQPWQVYRTLYPEAAPVEKLANYHMGRFSSGLLETQDTLLDDIRDLIKDWRQNHRRARLEAIELGPGQFQITDIRHCHHYVPQTYWVDAEQWQAITTLAPLFPPTPHQAWALERGLGYALDNYFIPLVIER